MSDKGEPVTVPARVETIEPAPAGTNGAGSLAVRADAPMVMDIRRSLPMAKAQFEAIQDFVREVLKEAVPEDKDKGIEAKDGDYGRVPGIAKPFLFKSGAEKISTLFGYAPVYVTLEKIEDFGERAPNGFFFYRYRCDLVSKTTGSVMGSGIGSCNSKEDRYRWKNLARTCPQCEKPLIIKGKAEFGGGWVCWSRTEVACGAKFPDGALVIEEQKVGREEREAFSLVNTIDKMAQKRALVAAVLIATGTSALFTQDEDTVERSDASVKAKPATVTVEPSKSGTAKPAAAQAFWRDAAPIEIERMFKHPEDSHGRAKNKKNTELPAGCRWEKRERKGPDGKSLGEDWVAMVNADVHGADPREAPAAAPVQATAAAKEPDVQTPAVAGTQAEAKRDIDLELQSAFQRGGYTIARVQVAARKIGATDGDWRKLSPDVKEKWLSALLDAENGKEVRRV